MVFKSAVEADEELSLGLKLAIAYRSLAAVERSVLPEPPELFNMFAVALSKSNQKTPPQPAIVYRFTRFFCNQMLALFRLDHYQSASQAAEAADPDHQLRYFRKLALYFAKRSFE
jgi:hypothetical protein